MPDLNLAIVTDGMWRKSLSAIRSLGKAGFRVHVCGDSWLTVGFWSRFTRKRVRMPDAREDAAAFGQALRTHLEKTRTALPAGKRPVLLPMEDDTLRYVVDHAAALRPYADFLVPETTALDISLDKAATMALASRLGIPHPRTLTAKSPAELVDAAAAFAGAEFIVKPVRGSGSRGVRYNPAFDAASAAAYWQTYGTAVIQDRIPPEGDAIGVSLLMGTDGACLAHFCHKRLRQYPNAGGPSTDRVGIADDALLEMSLKLLRELRWTGVAMVEWKIDPRDKQAKLLEINPRFWGSLELAVRSSVDFPVLYARAASGKPAVSSPPVVGVRCRWLLPGDVLRWLSAGDGNRESLAAFFAGLPGEAEEWDVRDLPGALASLICQGLAILQPKYWKFLSR